VILLQAHRVERVFLILCLPFLLFACGDIRSLPKDATSGEGGVEESVTDILHRLHLEQQRIMNLSAAFSLSLENPEQGWPSQIQGVIFWRKTEQNEEDLRIKGMSLLGKVIFDMVKKGNCIRIYVPFTRTLYRGKITDPVKGPGFMQPFTRALFPDFSSLKADEGASPENQGRLTVIPLKKGRLYLDRESGLIKVWQTPQRLIRYGGYFHQADLPPVPATIVSEALDGSPEIVCRLKQIQLNRGGLDMDMPPYDIREIRDLKALGR
jgi:hypothetical protein